MYEAFMVDYRLMPEEADERFSIRQMGELIKARQNRVKQEQEYIAELQSRILIKNLFGEGDTNGGPTETKHNDSPESMKVFGIKVTEEVTD